MFQAPSAFHRRAFARPDLRQIGRFAIVGLGRTVFSFGLYLLLLQMAPYWLAFTISFAVTIAGSAVANGRYVFLVTPTWRTYLLYAGVYSLNYLASLGLLAISVELIGIPQYLAPIVVIACMFPVNFVAERYVLQWNASHPEAST